MSLVEAVVEKTLVDPFSLIEELTPWAKEFKYEGYVFRGQPESSLPLVPSALRVSNKERLWSIVGGGMPANGQSEWAFFQSQAERRLLYKFAKLANERGLKVPIPDRFRRELASHLGELFASVDPLRSDIILPNELLELAAIAQHYGLPTRLLDWSFDPLTALYFACCSKEFQGSKTCVWCLNSTFLHSPEYVEKKVLIDFVVPPYSGNENLHAQRGVFTHVSQSVGPLLSSIGVLVNRTPLEKMIRDAFPNNRETHNVMTKIEIDAGAIERVKEILFKAGYGPARLFPGLGGVASQILQQS